MAKITHAADPSLAPVRQAQTPEARRPRTLRPPLRLAATRQSNFWKAKRLVLTALLVAGLVSASGALHPARAQQEKWTGDWFKITQIKTSTDAFCVATAHTSSPDSNCTVKQYYCVKNTHPTYPEHVSLILSAFLGGKGTKFHLSGCWGGHPAFNRMMVK